MHSTGRYPPPRTFVQIPQNLFTSSDNGALILHLSILPSLSFKDAGLRSRSRNEPSLTEASHDFLATVMVQNWAHS